MKENQVEATINYKAHCEQLENELARLEQQLAESNQRLQNFNAQVKLSCFEIASRLDAAKQSAENLTKVANVIYQEIYKP